MIYCLIAIIVEMRKSKYCMSARAYRPSSAFKGLDCPDFHPSRFTFCSYWRHPCWFSATPELPQHSYRSGRSVLRHPLVDQLHRPHPPYHPLPECRFYASDKLADKIDKKTSKYRRNTVVDTTVSNIYFVASQHNIDGDMGFA
ncbi:hypothetical protein L596_030083 [Steinernema carpocapsae]|uniref:Uncharacterized protein n=1 Tax=Steinernema carpocapsae TaxID=34508 RepID=A0A4U5LRP8_STECR|nr:hypothetical protein L596_030083 [Steinernema carpocapsae]